MIIFEKYEIVANDKVKNVNTGNFLKVEEKDGNHFTKIVVEGKTKRIKIEDYLNAPTTEEVVEENQNTEEVTEVVNTEVKNEEVVNEETTEETVVENQNVEEVQEVQAENTQNEEVQNEEVPAQTGKRKQSKKYKIVVTEMDDTQREFTTYKAANDYYGLRKDYLNYCIHEKWAKMLVKVNLKKVEKVML